MATTFDDDTLTRWMRVVLEHAWFGVDQGESPFAAAVYAFDGTQLSCEGNTVRGTNQPSRHGEVNAIDAACRDAGKPMLEQVWLISTGEPCPMCVAHAMLSGVRNIAFGASHQVIQESGYQTLGLSCNDVVGASNSKATLVSGILESECNRLLRENPKPD